MEFSPKLEKKLLIRWIVDTLWRTLVHYGYWLKEVEYQYGMEVALKTITQEREKIRNDKS